MSLFDRINAHPLPFAQLLGVEFMSAEPDAVAARMVVRPDLCTLGGVAHGGAIMSFADTLGGAAAFAGLPEGAILVCETLRPAAILWSPRLSCSAGCMSCRLSTACCAITATSPSN